MEVRVWADALTGLLTLSDRQPPLVAMMPLGTPVVPLL
jgi:hypothetical protein